MITNNYKQQFNEARNPELVGYNHLISGAAVIGDYCSCVISNKRGWNNCFINNNQGILQDLADFALQEQSEDILMVAISQAWYNGSY